MSKLEAALRNSWGMSANYYLEIEEPIHDDKFRRLFNQSGIETDDNTYSTVVTLIAGGYLEEATIVLKYKCDSSLESSGKLVSRIYHELKSNVFTTPRVLLGVAVGMVLPALTIVSICLWILSN
ncbi:MAG: hypothetical protein IME96_10380 [Proteobacteria bacterium]|nr:hypothetical protein [Pseudomonadota bacterium]